MVVDKNSKINEILSVYPDAKKFFNEQEMACGSCFAVNFDTLEKGALMHQLKRFLKNLPTPISSLQQK